MHVTEIISPSEKVLKETTVCSHVKPDYVKKYKTGHKHAPKYTS